MFFRKANCSNEEMMNSVCSASLYSINDLLSDAMAHFGDALKKSFCMLHGRKALGGQLYMKDGIKFAQDGITAAPVRCFAVCDECIICFDPLECIIVNLNLRGLASNISTSDDYLKGMLVIDDRELKFAMDKSPYRGENMAKEAKLRTNTALN